MPLCPECRKELSKIKTPNWLKLMTAAILVVFAASLVKFPKNLMIAVHYERAKAADKNLMYVTAVKEYEKVIEGYDDTTDLLARLYMGYRSIGEHGKAEKVIEKISGRKSENLKLVDEVNAYNEILENYYYPDEEFYNILQHTLENNDEAIDKIKQYLTVKKDRVFAYYMLANLLMDKGELEEAKNTMLTGITYTNRRHYPEGNQLLAAINREMGNYEAAINLCEANLKFNNEDFNAYASMARTELKRKDDKKALELAQKAYSIKDDSGYILATLSLCYHYNNMLEERDKYHEAFKNCESKDEYNLELLQGIYTGNISWR